MTNDDESAAGPPEFVKKLYNLLEDKNLAPWVSWGVEGTSFVVKDPTEFSKTVLPRHFKHQNFSSFVRQLNKYDFHKIKTSDEKLYGENAWEFQHPLFQYNKYEQLDLIRRKTPSAKLVKDPSRQQVQPRVNPAAVSAPGPSVDFAQQQFASPLNANVMALEQRYQKQIDELARTQSEMVRFLNDMARNYQMLVDEVVEFRTSMVNQDQVIQKLVEFLVSKESKQQQQQQQSGQGQQKSGTGTTPEPLPSPDPNGLTAQKILASYQTVSQKNIMHVTEIGKKLEKIVDYMKPGSPAITPGQPNQMTLQAASAPGLQFSGNLASPVHFSGSVAQGGTRSRVTPPKWIRPPKVLLVEDDAVCRNLSAQLLQRYGCTYDVANDGRRAIDLLSVGNRYDLILMDIMMPEMDGLACCDQIRQFDQETPIIAMTANTEKTQCMTYLAHRMNDILAKPFAKEALFSMLDRYCQQLISRDDEAEGTSNQIDQASIPQFHGGLIQQHMNDGRNSLPTPLGQPQQLGAGRPAGFDFPFPQDRWPPLPSPGQGPMSAPPQFGYHQQGGAVQGSYFPVHYGAQTPGPMPGYSAQQMQHMQPRYDEELYARPGGPGAPMGQMQQQS